MQVSVGREKAKRNIIIFIVGVFLAFLATVLNSIGDAVDNSVLSYFGFLSVVGVIFQIIAIYCLRNVNRRYASAMWALILNLLLTITTIILFAIYIATVNESLETAISWMDTATSFSEALIVIYFVLGTNELAEENGKGMPVLTKSIIYGYMGIFIISLIFFFLSFIPAIKENQTVVTMFAIMGIVLYVVREVSYVFFLIRSLWRVK